MAVVTPNGWVSASETSFSYSEMATAIPLVASNEKALVHVDYFVDYETVFCVPSAGQIWPLPGCWC